MSQSRAIRSAFGTVFRQPTIYLAELVWRSTFAITVSLLALYALIGYLCSMEVSDTDLLGLSGILPGTVWAALQHIFQGSGPMLLRMAGALLLGGAALWVVLATFGQSVTVAAIFGAERPALRETAGRNVARVALFLLTVSALFGAMLLALDRSQLASGERDRGKFFLLALPLWLLVLLVGSLLSSYLSVASLRRFVPRPWRSGRAQFAWVSFVAAGMRLALWVISFFALFLVLSMAMQVPAVLAWVPLVLFGLAYTAASTLIHLLKLAGYARVVAWEAEPREALAAVV